MKKRQHRWVFAWKDSLLGVYYACVQCSCFRVTRDVDLRQYGFHGGRFRRFYLTAEGKWLELSPPCEEDKRPSCPDCKRKDAVEHSSDGEAGISQAWCRFKCGWLRVV